MSHHAVALGIYISDILDIEDLFRLVAKKRSVVYNSDESDGEIMDELNEDTFWDIELYDDVTCSLGSKFEIRAADFVFLQFSYVHNKMIKIGDSDCNTFMIYIGESDTKQLIGMNIDEKTLTDLFDWERKLVAEKRLTSGGCRLLGKRNFIPGTDDH